MTMIRECHYDESYSEGRPVLGCMFSLLIIGDVDTDGHKAREH
jgi:hypothetical protein